MLFKSLLSQNLRFLEPHLQVACLGVIQDSISDHFERSCGYAQFFMGFSSTILFFLLNAKYQGKVLNIFYSYLRHMCVGLQVLQLYIILFCNRQNYQATFNKVNKDILCKKIFERAYFELIEALHIVIDGKTTLRQEFCQLL